MDEATARDYLARGLYELSQKQAAWDYRERNYRGDQDLPFAPDGVNAEYRALREQSIANWLGLAVDAPVQRCRVDGFRTGRSSDADLTTWNEVWQPNKLDARQRIPFTQMFIHGRGLMSVWPNARNRKTPVIAVENGKRVHLEPDPENPFETKWALKTFSIKAPPPSGLVLPDGVDPLRRPVDVAIVYDADTFVRFERVGLGTSMPDVTGNWQIVGAIRANPLKAVPFVPFDLNVDADGVPHSALEPLIPAQNAINTIRFNTLLAMQFSAFRQRVFVGYDPVVRDAAGNPVYAKDADGTTDKLDANGLKVPVLNSPGRVGVDRALVFPGKDTKVFDLTESNLKNYIEVLGEFLSQLFATGQIPPQYLLSRMANLSGDALTGAESTLASLVGELQRSMGESLEQVMRLANVARGDSEQDLASEVIWADTEARSFAQTIDAITKLISVSFPREAAFEMIPGATPPKVKRWMDLVGQEALDPVTQAIVDNVTRDAAATDLGA